MMHDEEQLLQPQQPNQTDEPGKQTLELARRIIARKNTQFILDHQNDTLEQLSAYLKACMEDPPPFANRKIVRDLYAALDSQLQRADAACTKEVRA